MEKVSPQFPKGEKMATKVIKSAKSKNLTMAQIMSAVIKAGEVNSSNGVKSFYRDGGAKVLAKSVAKAMKSPEMSSVGITTDGSREMAKLRREFAKSVKAIAVDGDEVLRKNTSDRTENAIRIRLRGVESVLGLPENTLYAIRANSYKVGEKSEVFIVRK
jgi:hypothetical protein